jgi:hypothetical protein
MLTQDLEDIRAGLRSGRFANEASVSQGIVLRLLNSLGWPTYDTQVVSPEYPLEGTRVDFALLHPPGTPRVFIEVKQIGQSAGAERQLFQYAFHRGVQFAVLTDGREWNFFLPGEVGDYGERRVYKLDLVDRDVAESASRLERYLQYESVCSGTALGNARADYQDVARARRTRDVLPAAWTKLVEEEDETLVELLADRVETECGYKPDPDEVARFLSQRIVLRAPVAAPPPPREAEQRRDEVSSPARTESAAGPQAIGYELLGVGVPCRNAREVLISLVEAVAIRDPAFLARFVSLSRHGRTRRYIAANQGELYPGRPDLAQEYSYKLDSGYWLGINLSRNAVQRICRLVCDVAGLTFGSDLKLHLG